MIRRKNLCTKTFQQRLQQLAQSFREEWDIQVIAPEEWSKLVFYAHHPEWDLPTESAQ